MIAVLGWIVLAFAASLLRRYLKWRWNPLNRIPGPIKEFTIKEWLFGVFPTIENESFMQPQQRWWKQAEDEAATPYDTQLLHYTGIFGKQFICVLDADGVKQILTSRAGVDRPLFVKGLTILKNVIGDGLVTIDGKKWNRHRRIIQPSFNNQFLKDAVSCVPDLVDRLLGAWRERAGSDIDVASHFSALTLDIIGKVAFSHEFRSMDSVAKWAQDENCQVELKDPLRLYSSLTPSVVRMLLSNLHLSSLEKYLLPHLHESQIILNEAVDSVVREAHKRYKNRDEASTKPKCLLELLFDAKDTDSGSRNTSLTHAELQDETKTFIVAGHETTASLCVWAVYCFIQNPRVQTLVLDDILNHAPKEGQITLESVQKMEYLEAFLHEVFRMYPPVGMVVRDANQWVNILGEKIPPKTRITIPIHLLHRHPKYWTDPECFKPERWLNSNEKDPKFHHFAYLPFSAGPRNCIGQRFAMWEAKLIMAPIIRDFEMVMSPSIEDVEIKLVSFVTTKSDPPITIHAKPRS